MTTKTRYAALATTALLLAGTAAVSAQEEIRPAAEILFPMETRGAGARAAGMGGAFVTLPGGADSLFFNPAGLAGAGRIEARLHHHEGFAGMREERFDAAYSLGRLGTVGGAVHRAGYGEVDSRDEDGNPVDSRKPERLGVSLGWGKEVRRGLSVGGSAHASRQWLGRGTAEAVRFDAGVQYQADARIRLGAAVRGLGPYSEAYLPPMVVEAGVQFEPGTEWPVLAAASFAYQPHGTHHLKLGAEQVLTPRFCVRVGSRIPFSREHLDGFRWFTAGFGFRQEALGIDYSVEPQGDLGFTHRISLGVSYPPSAPNSPVPTATPTSSPTPMPTWTPVPFVPTVETSPTPTPVLEDQLRVYYQMESEGNSIASDTATGRVKELLEAVRKPGAGPDDWWELGQFYELSGYPGYARNCYRRVLQMDPFHEQASQRLAILGEKRLPARNK